jgi:hypothetical protein
LNRYRDVVTDMEGVFNGVTDNHGVDSSLYPP